MIASSGGGIDLARLLLDLLVILAGAKVLAEVAERLKIPAVLGEILAGVLVGPSVLHVARAAARRAPLGSDQAGTTVAFPSRFHCVVFT